MPADTEIILVQTLEVTWEKQISLYNKETLFYIFKKS
jgi:hypothetical protein